MDRVRRVVTDRDSGAGALARLRLLAGAPTRHVDRRHRRAHPRCRRHPGPAEAIKTAATGWAAFWDGHLDLDALAVDVTDHLSDLTDDRCARW
ncbi:hypothetical protein IQ44_16555 [Mycobacterium tuberculosis]|nr:hypothetical protein IQ44_16555 [Mycobacterium tuberculosis]